MPHPKSIAIVITSYRGIRIGPAVASVVSRILTPALSDSSDSSSKPALTFSTIDAKSFNLPVFADHLPPKVRTTTTSNSNNDNSNNDNTPPPHPSGQAWNAAITAHDGYIFIVPEYNSGMAGSTKNAIDYLYHGFVGKPVMVVSYGGQGGRLANEQVSGVLRGMGLQVVEKKVELAWPAPSQRHGEKSQGGGNGNGNGRGPGPDALRAVLKGELGEDSEEAWVKDRAGDVLQAFGELKSLLGRKEGEE